MVQAGLLAPERHAPSQWRVRAGIAPASLFSRLPGHLHRLRLLRPL